jgi:hypothetical protein
MIVPVLCGVLATACTSQSPVVPSDAAAASHQLEAKPSATTAVYSLEFFNFVPGTGPDNLGRYEPIASYPGLPVNTGNLFLRGRVTDSAGNPVQKGTIRFEYCSFGRPYNDITRPDEAPKEACADGRATWTLRESRTIGNLGSCPVSMEAVGAVCNQFGRVQLPREIGFRISYQPQGSGFPAGASTPENFRWY